MEEIWKKVIGYEKHYEVSNLGNVKSLKNNLILKPAKTANYLAVSLCLNGKRKTCMIHQLVAESFLSHKRCHHKVVVNHKNFNKLDNNVENLELISARENTNRLHLNNSSKYLGVSITKSNGYSYFVSKIHINKKRVHLGMGKDEIKCSELYKIALNNIDKYDGDNFEFRKLINNLYNKRKN